MRKGQLTCWVLDPTQDMLLYLILRITHINLTTVATLQIRKTACKRSIDRVRI